VCNWIIDLHTGPIDDPARLDATLERIPGLVGHGLFLGVATRAIVAGSDGRIQMLERRQT
jgi:ribose 5-phosphate isomerase A